jgi:predicted DNA-binding transcriptional regulator AlpA
MKRSAKPAVSAPDDDTLIPDTEVVKMFSCTSMTLWRWDRDKTLNFPPKISIRRRNYRSLRALNEFRQRMSETALAERGKRREVAA